jgi:POTRA domain TamA domain 1
MSSMLTDPVAALPRGLTPADVDALRRHGFVAGERRRSGAMSYKLRWRILGRQRVRYLGSDPEIAAAVTAALATLQTPDRAGRELDRSLSRTRAELRKLRARSAAALNAIGYYWHGFSIRRTRPRAGDRLPPQPARPSRRTNHELGER